jgi:hypothetical protein
MPDTHCRRRTGTPFAAPVGVLACTRYFPIVKEDNARQCFQDEADFLRLLEELPNALKPFGCCAYYVGMRRGEMLRLDIAMSTWLAASWRSERPRIKRRAWFPSFTGLCGMA